MISRLINLYLMREIAALNAIFQEWNKSWSGPVNIIYVSKLRIPNEEQGIHPHKILPRKIK